MFSLLRTRCGPQASSTFGRIIQKGNHARSLATVQTTPTTGRLPPLTRPKGTPVSRERATLTIKVYLSMPKNKTSTNFCLGGPNFPWQVFWCQSKHFRRSCFHHLTCRIPRIHDRSLIPRTNFGFHSTFDWKLWSSIFRS
jgi:hypothetical protein